MHLKLQATRDELMSTNNGWDSAVEADYETPVFDQEPSPLEPHPVNYLSYLGSILSRYRRSLPTKEERSASAFGKRLSRYLGKEVSRNRIARAERSDRTVAWELIAAYLSDMGAWPDIINALEGSDREHLRYLILVERELKENMRRTKQQASVVLRTRTDREKHER